MEFKTAIFTVPTNEMLSEPDSLDSLTGLTHAEIALTDLSDFLCDSEQEGWLLQAMSTAVDQEVIFITLILKRTNWLPDLRTLEDTAPAGRQRELTVA